jgi:hypothetical protein
MPNINAEDPDYQIVRPERFTKLLLIKDYITKHAILIY